MVHQVGQAHDAQADAAGAVGGFFELGDGRDVGVGFDDVVEEDGREGDGLAQALPVDGVVRAEVLGEVDRAETAVLIGAKPLLAAGVGGFELVEVGDGVGAVGRVEEEHAGLAVVVGLGDDFVEDIARADGFVGLDGQAGLFGRSRVPRKVL